jgi:hypothetical protein
MPLFTVPKPGHPGQYRCFADMLKGRQNASVCCDPIVLLHASHILDKLYHGGWSTVFDISKYFYNFPTQQDDRPYLGMLHPCTHDLLVYFGLPMGVATHLGLPVAVERLSFDLFVSLITSSRALHRPIGGGWDSPLMVPTIHQRVWLYSHKQPWPHG